MNIITLANQKGGCGKTVTAVNLAGAFAMMGRKVLVIDMDPQGHAASALGAVRASGERNSYALFENLIKGEGRELISFASVRYDGLAVIPSHIGLSTIERRFDGGKDSVETLRRALRSGQLDMFDYVIIDTAPYIGFLTLNCIYAADTLIIPVDISAFSVRGVSHMETLLEIYNRVEERRFDTRYLVTLYDPRSNFSKTFLGKLRENYGEMVFNTVIHSNIALREAAYAGKVIFEHNMDSRGAQDYAALAREISPERPGEDFLIDNLIGASSKRQAFFRLRAPDAGSVYLVGDFNKWRTNSASAMKKLEDGTWVKNMPLQAGTHKYRFIVDGKWTTDPENPLTEPDHFNEKESVINL